MEDAPQVQVSADIPDAQDAAADISNEIKIGGTPETTNPQPEQPETSGQTETPVKKSVGFNFLDFLTSPIIEIIVGKGDEETVLTAHQTLLLDSPFLSEFVEKFDTSGPRRIHLPDEDVEAFGCFLQFKYTRDYTVTPPETPSASQEPEGGIDNSGEELLRHARVYTLAEKLGVPALKSLAHTKIHRVNGTPNGELAYARYVYTHTSQDDTTIRKPVASYWASRGHILRHDVQEDWDQMCREVPEFTFDVVTLLMDRKEKTGQTETESTPRGRKRLRASEK
ncbi:uncharacterized protein N7482_010240 [Penicillium canariense]|uniref:BTB domain-containing protein n=1 Tax=Penicillium canariense TaxID=189055 RepID=A0A9W9HLM2_9EURO|nr:uncharacterized protein N7482_010240 [Penicillium canariense]KAJ5150988.1 hypothetical protein N7482_010240 [Penicillium canariense]